MLDGSSGEGLPGANIYFEGTGIGASSQVDGYFVLSKVPAGQYTLHITYLGFETVELPLELLPGESLRRDFELQPQPLSLEEVEVTGKRVERQTNIQLSRVKLNIRQLRGVPQVGEADLMRTLQALPGVLTTAEFSTGLVIRGGNTDQNLILLDGITVYNPSHLGGLFSSFILDVIKEADLIKGGFNAEYGGRLSAVLNVRSREGNQKHFDSKVSLSLLSAQTTLEGPIGKGAWVMAGRRTYFDQIFKGTDLYFPYYFYDLQGHVFQDLTDRDRVSMSWYVGRDNLLFDALGLSASWGNQTFSGNYRKLWSSRLVSHWMLAKSRFDTRFDLGGDLGLTSTNIINDLTFQSDWTYFASQTTEFRFGTQVKDLSIGYKSTFLDSILFDVNQSPLESVLYGKVKRWITPLLMVEPGLRVTHYDGHPTKWFFDPRLNVKYLLTPDRYLNGAVGLYHQFIETVQDDFNPSILDQWVAV
ncbi:MAG: TonB-dependent receptor, partial [Candidatus Marinimicrobia bacterium]|nr:TonB-dependent receptor [Candidatus Neomarinimicrobiota bacterium]